MLAGKGIVRTRYGSKGSSIKGKEIIRAGCRSKGPSIKKSSLK